MATAPICSCLEVPNEEGGGHQEAIKGSSGDIRRHRESSAASSHCGESLWRVTVESSTLRGSRTKPSRGHPTQSEAIKAMSVPNMTYMKRGA